MSWSVHCWRLSYLAVHRSVLYHMELYRACSLGQTGHSMRGRTNSNTLGTCQVFKKQRLSLWRWIAHVGRTIAWSELSLTTRSISTHFLSRKRLLLSQLGIDVSQTMSTCIIFNSTETEQTGSFLYTLSWLCWWRPVNKFLSLSDPVSCGIMYNHTINGHAQDQSFTRHKMVYETKHQ